MTELRLCLNSCHEGEEKEKERNRLSRDPCLRLGLWSRISASPKSILGIMTTEPFRRVEQSVSCELTRK